MSELKKCPFCGGDADIQNWSMRVLGRDRFSIACNHCDVETPIYETEQGAIEAWNRRANSD